MSVYVDPMMPCIPNKNWKYRESCHMYADTEPELLAMAAAIGLKYSWLQKTSLVHFDLTRPRRIQAIAHGAIEHSREDLVSFMRLHSRRRQPPLEPVGTWVVKQGGNIEHHLIGPRTVIMRPTVWGNPYKVVEYGHGVAIAKYVVHLCRVPTFWKRIRTQLRGKCLVCCCHVDIAPALRLREPGEVPGCHGDVLAYVADGGDPHDLLHWAQRTIEENR